mgnify:CR=1 FL=1
MKNINKKRIVLVLVFLLIGSLLIKGSVEVMAVDDYGAKGAKQVEDYTLEEMLVYAIQDEYLALAEYELIINEFGEQRPFSNIIKAEKHHIELLIPLFEKYDINIPSDNSTDHVILPTDIKLALETGVKAEVENIEMYDNFLKKDIPEDVSEIFNRLLNGSRNHLRAFENGLNRNNRVNRY